MDFSLFTPRSNEELREYFHLRWRYLRAPFDLPQGSERDEHDAGAHHVAAVATNDKRIIGGARMHLNENGDMQVRYMAVADDWRRRGVASAMLRKLEGVARDAGHRAITLNARDTALPFYACCGYTVVGDTEPSELVVSLPHYKMRKDLTRKDARTEAAPRADAKTENAPRKSARTEDAPRADAAYGASKKA